LRVIAREKLEIVLSASASRRGGWKGGWGGIPPAEPVNEIGSDIFKYTPLSPAEARRAKEGFGLIIHLKSPGKVL